jgi:hypothetical protein
MLLSSDACACRTAMVGAILARANRLLQRQQLAECMPTAQHAPGVVQQRLAPNFVVLFVMLLLQRWMRSVRAWIPQRSCHTCSS